MAAEGRWRICARHYAPFRGYQGQEEDGYGEVAGRHRQTVDMDSGIVRDMVCYSVLMWRRLKSRQKQRTRLTFARNAMRDIDLNLLTALDVLLQQCSVTRAALRLRLSTSAMSRTLSRLREALGDPVLGPAQTRRQPAGPRSEKTARPWVALRNWAHRCRNAK